MSLLALTTEAGALRMDKLLGGQDGSGPAVPAARKPTGMSIPSPQRVLRQGSSRNLMVSADDLWLADEAHETEEFFDPFEYEEKDTGEAAAGPKRPKEGGSSNIQDLSRTGTPTVPSRAAYSVSPTLADGDLLIRVAVYCAHTLCNLCKTTSSRQLLVSEPSFHHICLGH